MLYCEISSRSIRPAAAFSVELVTFLLNIKTHGEINNAHRERSTKELELNIKLTHCVFAVYIYLVLLKLHQRRHLVLPNGEIKQWARAEK
jgi:hypothetical protein